MTNRILFALFASPAIFASQSDAEPFYRETFEVSSEGSESGRDADALSGWRAFRSNSLVGRIGLLKISKPGSPAVTTAIGSSSTGAADGAAFWSRPVLGLTVFTDEVAVDVTSLNTIQYQQRLSGADIQSRISDGTRLALLIGTTWYISDQVVLQQNRGAWEAVTLGPKRLTYGTSSSRDGRGPEAPRNSGKRLPRSGQVSAFGVFVPIVNGRVRIDNYLLSKEQPESVQPPQLPPTSGSSSSATAGGSSTALAGEDEGDDNGGESSSSSSTGSALSSSSSSSSPPSTSTPVAPSANWCSNDRRRIGKVRLSANGQVRLLKAVRGRTLAAIRDRAILGLLFQQGVRVDSLRNLSMANYYSIGTAKILTIDASNSRGFVLKDAPGRALASYIKASGLRSRRTAPLFPKLNSGTGLLEPLCPSDLQKLVRAYARTAKQNESLRFQR